MLIGQMHPADQHCLSTKRTHPHNLDHQASFWTAPVLSTSQWGSRTSTVSHNSFHLVQTSILVPSSRWPTNVHTQASGWGHTLHLEPPLELQQAPHSSSSAPWNWKGSNLSAWGCNQHGQVNALCQKWVLVTCDTVLLATCLKQPTPVCPVVLMGAVIPPPGVCSASELCDQCKQFSKISEQYRSYVRHG